MLESKTPLKLLSGAHNNRSLTKKQAQRANMFSN